MSADGRRTKWRRNIGENFNRLSRAHERYKHTDDGRQTDGRAMTYSEREREFMFAKNRKTTATRTYIGLTDNCLPNE